MGPVIQNSWCWFQVFRFVLLNQDGWPPERMLGCIDETALFNCSRRFLVLMLNKQETANIISGHKVLQILHHRLADRTGALVKIVF